MPGATSYCSSCLAVPFFMERTICQLVCKVTVFSSNKPNKRQHFFVCQLLMIPWYVRQRMTGDLSFSDLRGTPPRKTRHYVFANAALCLWHRGTMSLASRHYVFADAALCVFRRGAEGLLTQSGYCSCACSSKRSDTLYIWSFIACFPSRIICSMSALSKQSMS